MSRLVAATLYDCQCSMLRTEGIPSCSAIEFVRKAAKLCDVFNVFLSFQNRGRTIS